MAYRDFPSVFSDEKLANGLDGKNQLPDVLDEAKWGLDWLLKMHPRDDWMFNQLGDDRDHISMRIPKMDSQYGKGFERPVYFIDGKPQQRGKYVNNTTGTKFKAAKFASAFGLGYQMFEKIDKEFSSELYKKTNSALLFSLKKKGVTQTASVRAPYIYAEDNWVDDLELALAQTYTYQKFIFDNWSPGFILSDPALPSQFCFRQILSLRQRRTHHSLARCRYRQSLSMVPVHQHRSL